MADHLSIVSCQTNRMLRTCQPKKSQMMPFVGMGGSTVAEIRTTNLAFLKRPAASRNC